MIEFFIRSLLDRCLVRHAANSGWLSVAAASAVLGCSELTVRRRIKNGDLPACRPGHAYRVWGPDLDKFVRSRPAYPGHEIQRKPFPAQMENGAERRERAEAGLRALRRNWRSEVARFGLEPETLFAAFADEYEHHPEDPATALTFALKGMRNPAWLSEHRPQALRPRLTPDRGRLQIEMLQRLASLRLAYPDSRTEALTSLRAAGIQLPAEAMRLFERELGPQKMTRCVNGHDVSAYLRFCSECGVRMVAHATEGT